MTLLRRFIRSDPFMTIGELKRAVNGTPGVDPVGWWQLFFLLKRHNLLSKRSRFRLARGRQ